MVFARYILFDERNALGKVIKEAKSSILARTDVVNVAGIKTQKATVIWQFDLFHAVIKKNAR